MQISECRYFVDPNIIKKKKYCEYGDLIIAGVSENKQDVGKAVVYLGHEKPMIGMGIRLIKHKQNPKFLSYMFTTKYVRKQMQSIAQPSTIFNLYVSKLKNVKIPLPSLEEQEQIVQTLDQLNGSLKDLEIQIKTLIVQREKQYNFLCNQLLSKNGD